MPSVCPACYKPQPAAAGVSFCAYCGVKLIDPERTTDMPTQSFSGRINPDELPAATPDRVGTYRLGKKLGSGGMGSVFEAESDSGDRVAVKLLSPRLAASQTSVERFRQEGRLASQISHPRCVFVYAADTDAGRPFIVMELMPGSTLKDLVDRRGKLPVGEAVARMLDVIDGLAEAHRFGVIHRDVKPSNCFLTADDRVKIGDFGLSKSLGGSEADKQLTNTGAFLGTVLFASPEQIRGEDVGYDSDVYSVAGTLFYTLTGRAPYQHENLTAALAKAISEPPPSARKWNPLVPRNLDRVIRRGLDRDRNRRYGTLEELRDALADFLPGQRLPARPRAAVAAYLIDALCLLVIVQIPFQIIEMLIGGRAWLDVVNLTGVDPGPFFGTVVYFTLLEGLTGTTAGKWLLHLRVSKVGEVGPPGLKAALIRTLTFNLLLLSALSLPMLLDDIPFVGVPLAAAAVGLGLVGLFQQVRPSRNFRGLHDAAAGTRVTVKPRPPHRMKLPAPAESPFDRVKPLADAPASVGGYTVKGLLADLPGGAAVWAAEDRALGRKVFVWVRPGTDHAPPPTRATRLRVVGTGGLSYRGKICDWVAFAAPAGGPLLDCVSPAKPLPWDDARLLLEQLSEELKTGESDGTLPPRLGVDQLWAEPAGRLHFLEFPLPTKAQSPPPAAEPADMLRQAATLALEGSARSDAAPVRAPLPPHAKAVTDALADGRLPTVGAFASAVAETHAHPPRVTAGMRLAHAGLTAMLAGFGLVTMFALCLMFQFWTAMMAVQQRANAAAVQTGLADPGIRAKWAADPRLADIADPAQADAHAARLDKLIALEEAEFETRLPGLSRLERYALGKVREFTTEFSRPETAAHIPAMTARQLLDQAARMEARGDGNLRQDVGVRGITIFILGFFLTVYVAFAVAFRGGVSYLLAGLTLVRKDGRRAGRLRCGVRELFVWLPVFAALALAVALQWYFPHAKLLRLFAAVACIGVLLGWVIVAVRLPGRGPQDRLAGTFVVPV